MFIHSIKRFLTSRQSLSRGFGTFRSYQRQAKTMTSRVETELRSIIGVQRHMEGGWVCYGGP